MTLIELLFAITILSVLTSIVFGGIGKTREHIARTQEVSGARFLIGAFHTANADLGRVFSAEQTQSNLGPAGNAMNLRYGIHLMTYTSEADWQRVLYLHESQRKEIDKYRNNDLIGLRYILSLYPALGMNSPNVGGTYEDGRLRGVASYVYATELSNVHHPEKLVVFMSAGTGAQTRYTSMIRGYFRVLPPFDQKYPEDGNTWGNAAEEYPSNTGNAHFRWEGKAVVAFFDGSISLQSAKDLDDPLHWENRPY